jgi:4-amino-4-deoxychorismate lyase
MKRLNDTLFLEALKSRTIGSRTEYRAFYSSFLGGVTTEPHHMVVPIDDHMVHRGDAVFEAVKFMDREIFALDRHLERLEVSMNAISLKPALTRIELTETILETVRISGLTTGLIRLFIARGPGGFTTNPFETIGTQVYCAITTYTQPAAEKYLKGVTTGRSVTRVKDDFYARTKSCNYLPNVMMKKEALDRKLDFVISQDEDGFIAEGSTENFALIDHDGKLQVPSFERILRGITAVRSLELAEKIGIGTSNRRFKESDIRNAKGAVMLGTTIDILPVTSFEDHRFAGIPEETARLIMAFAQDVKTGPLRTKF